jgi:dihydrolipoamide dehydrogenase
VLTSREALAGTQLPKSVVIVGAGAIGVEFAYFYNAFGTKVTLVEMLPAVLPVEDEEVSKTLQRSLEKQGVRILTGTKCENFRVGASSVKVDLVTGEQRQEVEADVLLSAIGVVANLEGLLGPAVKLELDRNYVKVGDDYQTSVKGIYAAGDIIGPPWLAHVASFEAFQCVDGLFVEGYKPRKVTNFPGCTYCHPQVASVGKTERALKEEGVEYVVGKIPFVAIGKAVAAGETDGFAKLLYGKKHGELLGAHIIGDNATELIAEMGLALDQELTIDEIHATIHAHPTMSEVIHEATLAAEGHAIHF